MYEPIQFPVHGPLRDMDKKSVQVFFDWFVAAIPARLKALEEAVGSDLTSKGWKPDASPDSLHSLGEWYVRHISTRQRTNMEVSALRHGLTIPVEIDDWDLDGATYSITIDIGIYLGEMLKAHCENLKWDVVLKDKRFIDYGCPVITGFGKSVMNPMRICAVMARGIVRGVADAGRLFELYQTWLKLGQNAGPDPSLHN